MPECGKPTTSGYPCLLGRQAGADGCRWHRTQPDAKVIVWVNGKVASYLDQLVECGLFGGDRAEVLERLACDGIIRLMKEPFIDA